MVLNPDKCHFMVLGDSNCTCNFTCNGTTIESSKEEKVLAITIDDKLTFTSHLEKCLRLVTSDYDSNFNELLESYHELSIHKTCINYLMIEVYKYLYELSPELMIDIFTLRNNPYSIRNNLLFGSENPCSVRFGVDATALRASQLCQKVPISIKYSLSLSKKLWSCDDCPGNLCKRFIANVGYIWFI